MNDPEILFDADLVDEATIDGATDGVSSGHGMLASMMSWVRGTVARALPGHLIGGVRGALLPKVDPKAVTGPGNFDPVVLMNALQAYNKRYGAMLRGKGLLLRLGQWMPPAAFPATADSSVGGAVDTSSYHADDFEDANAAIAAIGAQRLAQPLTNQFNWLVNAILVRAAVEMAPFVYATPRFELDSTTGKATLAFDHAGETTYVNVDRDSSPLSLHRNVRSVIQGIWRATLTQQMTVVASEFMTAMRGQRLSKPVLDALEREVGDALKDHKPLAKMRGSSAAFISISKVFEACATEMAKFDRAAARNALRHGSTGLNWRNYLVHVNPSHQAEIAAAEPLGALAYASYTPALLKAVHDVNLHNTSGFLGSGGPASAEFSGALTQTFLAALRDNVNDDTRQAFAMLTPRYLCVLACGHHSIHSFERHLHTHGLSAEPDGGFAIAAAAGRRLAGALNQVMAQTPAGKPALPWSRVMTSRSLYELLVSDETDERATSALATLIGYANHMRAKGGKASDVTWHLPSPEDVLSAPAGNAIASLVPVWQSQDTIGQTHASKAALNVVRDLFAGVEPVQTRPSTDGVKPSRPLKWNPLLASVRPAYAHENDMQSGVRLAMRHGAAQKSLCSVMEVYARTSKAFSETRQMRVTDESFAFAVRGEGTPESVAPLVLEVRIPDESRLRQLSGRRTKLEGWVELSMGDISGSDMKDVYIASRVADADRPFLPAMKRHVAAALPIWVDRVHDMLERQPFQAASVFPAVASFLWCGGKLADKQKLRPLGAGTAFKLARACLGADNPHGMGLICRYAARPSQRSSTGASLLDLALDSSEPRVAKGALEGLKKNAELVKDAGELADLVQASLGKLIERHPQLLPFALSMGARMDDAAQLTWSHLHPQRRTPELDASVNEALMREVIARRDAEAALAAAAAAPAPESETVAPTRLRRRMGAV
jgi:hypothetical protein